MLKIIKKIEDAFVAATFAEAGEHEYARNLLQAGKNSHKKVLLSTDCPVVTTQVLNHAFNLCKRLGSGLEVYQIIPREPEGISAMEYFEKVKRRLQNLQERLSREGITYNYVIKEANLREELGEIARKRRDFLAIIVPLCEDIRGHKDDFRNTISQLFNCPVIFFETNN